MIRFLKFFYNRKNKMKIALPFEDEFFSHTPSHSILTSPVLSSCSFLSHKKFPPCLTSARLRQLIIAQIHPTRRNTDYVSQEKGALELLGKRV